MADFDPGWLTKRESGLANSRMLQWPRALALWRGLVEPRFLLLTRPVFPTIVRLPSPRIYPALALQVLQRWNPAATATLPFLARRVPAARSGMMPQYDYRLRHIRKSSPFFPPLDRLMPSMDTWAPVPAQTQVPPQENESGAQDRLAVTQPLFQETWWEPTAERQVEPSPIDWFSPMEAWQEAWDTFRELPALARPFRPGGPRIGITAQPTPIYPRGFSSETLLWQHLAEPAFDLAPPQMQQADLIEEILARHMLPALSFDYRTETGAPPGRIYRRPFLASPASLQNVAHEILPLAYRGVEREPANEGPATLYLPAASYPIAASLFPLADRNDMPQEILLEHLDLAIPIEALDLGIRSAIARVENPELIERILPRSSAAATPSQVPQAPRTITQRAAETQPEQAGVETPQARPVQFGYTPSPRRMPWRQVRPLETQVLKEWPVLDIIRRLDMPPVPMEPAPLQILRSLPPEQAQPALAAIEALPTLGEGERLGEPVKTTMESLIGRDLSNVQVYSSPAAQELGAAAFTTGERIVFAPGRKQFASREGLALLGHELAHLGQSLGFRPLAETGSWTSDGAEHLAQQQEQMVVRHLAQQELPVENHLEQAWSSPPTMQVRYETPPTAAAAAYSQAPGAASVGAGSPRPEPAVAPEVQGVSPSAATSTGGAATQSAATSAGESTSVGGTSGAVASPNLESLARQVYAILKRELRAERDRHQLYSR